VGQAIAGIVLSRGASEKQMIPRAPSSDRSMVIAARVREKRCNAMNTKIPAANVKLKRTYESPTAEDGARILIDRLWPRGISKKKAALDQWMKDIAPSAELRKWFGTIQRVGRIPPSLRRRGAPEPRVT
jgi:hypothetical protein